jgi:hypothetical protein
MTVSRRTLIKGGALSVAATVTAPHLFNDPDPAVIVYDSRSPASFAFAGLHHGQRIDIAQEDPRFWLTLRTLAKQGAVKGMTGWSDFVIVRGLLQERGMRILQEKLEGDHCHWTMV